jgi:hypothetical protein
MSPTTDPGRVLLAITFLALPGLARADDPAVPSDADEVTLPSAAPIEAPAPASMPVPHAFVAAQAGAAVPLAGLEATAAIGLEGGVVLPMFGGRLLPVLGLAYAGPTGTGTVSDPAFPDGYRWDLDVRIVSAALGLRVRLLPWSEPLSPELAIGPTLDVHAITLSGRAGTGVIAPEHDVEVAAGGFVSAGVAGRLGPGQLTLQVALTAEPLHGVLTGDILLPTLTPSVGYRILR